MTTPVPDFVTNNTAPFAVFSHDEGAWGNSLKTRFERFIEADNQFDVVVLRTVDSVDIEVEKFTVTSVYKKDGRGRQLFIEDVINGKSDYIYIVANEANSNMPEFKVTGEVLPGFASITDVAGTLANLPDNGSLVIDLVGDGTGSIKDLGNGVLSGTYDGNSVSGSLNYVTGDYSITFSVATDADVVATAAYSKTTTLSLASGSNGDPAIEAHLIEGWDLYRDPNRVDIRLAIEGEEVSVSQKLAIKQLCEKRLDCFGIVSTPTGVTDTADLLEWRNTTAANISSSYIGIYGPFVTIYDTYTARRFNVPASGFIAALFAATDRNQSEAVAAAGLRRGILPVEGVEATYEEDSEYALLYPKGINLIMNFIGEGDVLWGNRTAANEFSALSAVNSRRALIKVEKALTVAARKEAFENNTPENRLRVFKRFNQFMKLMKAQGIVVRYKVVVDETNNTDEVIDDFRMKIDVYIDPPRPAEVIELQTVVTSSGASFTELAATGGNF